MTWVHSSPLFEKITNNPTQRVRGDTGQRGDVESRLSVSVSEILCSCGDD